MAFAFLASLSNCGWYTIDIQSLIPSCEHSDCQKLKVNWVSQSETINTDNPHDRMYPSINTFTRFSAARLASLMGIHCSCFVRGSMIIATTLCPVSNVSSLVTKSMFILLACWRGIGSVFSRQYGLVFLCLTRWHVSHPATYSATESINFGQWYHMLTAAAVFEMPLCPLPRITSCTSQITSTLNSLGIHNFLSNGLWYRRHSSSI